MEPTWENIQPLIVSAEEDGMMIKLKFKASNQETPFETMAAVVPDQDEIMKNAMKQVGKSAAISTGANLAGSALGNAIGGLAGDITKSAASQAGSAAASASFDTNKLMQGNVTDSKKQAAIVQAFGHFQTYYKWENDQWMFNG